MIRIIYFPFIFKCPNHFQYLINPYPFQFNSYPFQFNPYPFQYLIFDLIFRSISILVLCIICILIAKRKRLKNVYRMLFFLQCIKHFSYQDTFKASYCSRHFYFSPVRHFPIARHKYRRLRHLFF